MLLNFERGPAPPISLSSPELGAESEGFEEHIRNSYSSSELLYERNLNRFNGYSKDEALSSEAQKIAIYAMDRKNSLRRSPITRRSTDGSEEKSVFSDSDSIHSVVDVSKRTNATSFMSLTNSIEEEDDDLKGPTADGDDGIMVPTTSFADLESETSKKSSDDDEYVSDSSDEAMMNFGSGKRALEHNASSAFFSTVYYDDDYLSDHRLSDKERSKSASPAKEPAPRSDDAISQDSLNSGSVSSSASAASDRDNVDRERSSPGKTVENHIVSAEICAVEPPDRYRPRDGIPKYVMLPNPFYREHMPAAECSNRVKFELSSNSDGIVPPEILPRTDHHYRHGTDGGHGPPLPVITVTETGEYSPTSKLKKIFVPSLAGRDESYYQQYNNVNSSTFNTLRKSPERENGPWSRQQWTVYGDDARKPSPPEKEPENAEMVVVKHYGDIVERYSEVAKKTVPKTVYMDFEQLKMAAVEVDEPVVVPDAGPPADVDECDDGEFEAEGDDGPPERDADGSYGTYGDGPRSDDYGPAATADNQLAVLQQQVPVPMPIPYVKVFGNLSLALFGYWLYTYKDEKLSVPVFGFLLFRFFKTQIWDRI